MKLFTKAIDQQLFKQFSMGSSMNQNVVAKIFNPYGRGYWYIMNSDPQDPDYLWGIVDLGYGAEVGSIRRKELERVRVKPFMLPLERDISFSPRPAKEVFEGLGMGKRFEHGGEVDDENAEMLKNQAYTISHHSEELTDISKKVKNAEPWVITKAQRASTDLADITHYLEGEESKLASGGSLDYANVSKNELEKILIGRYLEIYNLGVKEPSLPNKIISVDIDEPKYRYRYVRISVDKNYAHYSIPLENLKNFLGGNSVEVMGEKEPYVIKLVGKSKMASGGMMADVDNISERRNGDINVNYQGNKYIVAYSADGYDNPYGIVFEDEDIVTSINSPKAKKVWKKIKPIIDAWKRDKMSRGDKMAKGGKLDINAFKKKYDRNEEANAHSENVLLLAKQFGSEQDVRDARTILAKHDAIGYLPENLYQEREALRKKLWKKYMDAKGDGSKMASGGKVKKKYKIGDKVVYASNGRWFVRNKPNFKNGVITDIEEVGNLKIELFTIKLNDGSVVKTNDKKEIDFDPDEPQMASGGMMPKKENKYKVPTLEEIRGWDDEKLTDLRWAYDKVRFASGHNKMFVKNWFDTLMKRIKIVKKERGIMADGGEIKFSDKVAAIKRGLLERKKVSPKVQKDYGKTYSPKEAEESAKRIAGAIRKKEMSK